MNPLASSDSQVPVRMRDRLQAEAERVLADTQIAWPALLGLDVAIAVEGRLLCRSGRGDLRPRAEILLAGDGRFMALSLPKEARQDHERALQVLTGALESAVPPSGPLPQYRVPG